MISVCFAGVTGWTAPPIVAAIDEADDLTLSSGVSRSAAGQSLATAAGSADADDEEDALAEALREAPADTFPQIAALSAELMSGTGPDRLAWGFRVLINGITQPPRPQEREPRGNPQLPGA